VHIQSWADSDDGNGVMAMVMIAMMIVLVMVIIVPEALRQVDSVLQHSGQTFQQLRDFHRPDSSRGTLNSSGCMHLSAADIRTNDHKCNVVGCTAKQGSLCGHRLEKCPNFKGNHIAFSSRCMKKREDTTAVRLSTNIALAGQASTGAAQELATGSNGAVLGPRPQGVAGGGGDEEEMADEDE